MTAVEHDTIAPVSRPPRELLLLAAASVVIGAALLVPAGVAVNVAGYVLSSFVTIGLLAAYQRVDVTRRNRPRYVADHRLRRLGPIVAVAGILVAAVHVWRIATELAG